MALAASLKAARVKYSALEARTPPSIKWSRLSLGYRPKAFAIRGLMHEAALQDREDPDRLSFLHAVRVVRRKLPQGLRLVMDRRIGTQPGAPAPRCRAFPGSIFKGIQWVIIEDVAVENSSRLDARGR